MKNVIVFTLLLSGVAVSQAPARQPPVETPSIEPGDQRDDSSAETASPLADWLDNPRSLTARGLEQLDSQPESAAESFRRALELSPDDPLLLYNAGTAALLTGDSNRTDLLERAIAIAPPALAARSAYNLGNAYFERQNHAAAVEAYKRALRHQPGFKNAKVNLELALNQLTEQTASQENPQQVPDPGGGNRSGDNGGGGGERPPSGQPPPGDTGEPSPTADDGRLPRFRDQPELTAQEAAAILDAVENLERQQRAELARQQNPRDSSGDKDW